jgi:dTDP-4-dehydrorhamnose reductase
MKYLIFGKNGWLAQKFNKFLDDSYISDVDITDLAAIRKELADKKPEIVINAAGITGRPNIDWCEEHKLETVAGNVTGPLNILQACSEQGIYWVHLGSGCIFQGKGPRGKGFREEDEANPPSFYSWTKYWADSILKNFPILLVRLRLPIDIEPSFRNLIDKLIKYPEVIDSENSVTVIPDLLEATKKLIDKKLTGIYHAVNPGTIKPSEIMKLYQKIIDPNHQFKIISDKALYKKGLAKAVRSNCILNTDKLKKEGIILKPIKERIIEVIKEYKTNL